METQSALAADNQAVHLCTANLNAHAESEPAVAAYRWDWGEDGFCCAKCQLLLRQKSPQLGRHIEFRPLPNLPPAALSRDERVRYHAQVLTLEDELRDVKARGVELYQSNTKLAEEARRLAARNRELEAQVKDARADLQMAAEARDQHAADLADAHTELQRLRAILPATPAATPAPTAGG